MKIKLSVFLFVVTAFCASAQEIQPQVDYEKNAREFVTMLNAGEYDKILPMLDSTMKKVFDQPRMKQTWESLTSGFGAFVRFVKSEVTQPPGYHVVVLTCEFAKSPLNLKIAYNSKDQIAGMFALPANNTFTYKAPDYVKSDQFEEKDVTIGSGEFALPGTLTLPKGNGPFPAVVLVHGSGPNDRDETIGPNKPFRDLAWGLASRGIAVVRYEKRTRHHAEQVVKELEKLTVHEETVEDAVLAANMLAGMTEIKKDKIFIVGHSLGAMMAPRIGSLCPNAAGLVIMAGTDRKLEDVYVEQIEYIASLDGGLDSAETEQINIIKRMVKNVKSLEAGKAVNRDSLIMQLPAGYWLDLNKYSPAETLNQLTIPTLIMQGERDYQVDMKSFELWKSKLSNRANTDYKLYPKLNHLFIEGEGKCTPDEYNKESHIPAYVINDIATWITR